MLGQLGAFYGRLLWFGIGAALLVVAVVSGWLIVRGTPVTTEPLVSALKVAGLIAAGFTYMAFAPPSNRERIQAGTLWQPMSVNVETGSDRAGRRKSAWYTGAAMI